MTYQCGKPRGWIKKVGWKGGEEKWPCAYEAIHAFKIDNETMGGLIVKPGLEAREGADLVQERLDDNLDTWPTWTACVR